MNPSPAIRASHLVYHYGRRKALADLSLDVARGEIFAFLGPNGGGKTTLFRLLSTLIPLQSGTVEILSFDLGRQTSEIRRAIGVVFQAPSLDKKLTVAENIRHQGNLYGLSGAALRQRRCRYAPARWAWPIGPASVWNHFRADCAAAWNWPRA